MHPEGEKLETWGGGGGTFGRAGDGLLMLGGAAEILGGGGHLPPCTPLGLNPGVCRPRCKYTFTSTCTRM